MSDDYAANAQTTGSVAVGGSATGTIESAYDHDWFAVELMAGRTYRFDLQGSPGGGGTLPDTYFRAIRNSEGRYQSGTYNDNFEGSRDSRVTFTPSESGTYYAQVSGDRNETGTYTLSVSDVTPPEAVNPPPAFDQQSYAFDLAEETDGSANRLSLGTVSATDPDGGSVSYSIEGGNAAGRFEIDAASGELFYVGGGEDYETGSTRFELTVRASDGDQTTDTSVTVNVTDVAEAPTFAQAGYTFDLAEETDGSANRLSLGTVSATDPDGGSVTYSIEGGNAAALFEIDAASGELFYVGAGEDYETGSTSFDLTVRASDGDQTTDTSVTVNVTDVDEPVEVDPPVTEPDQSTPQTVSEPSGEDFARNSSTSGRVAVGDTATGRIGSNGDRDWFAVELVAGRTYVIDLRGSPTGDGTLSDPYLRGIYDADGDRISNTTDDDGGQSYNSRVSFTATESGTHYIAAGAYSSRQGTYELEVTDTSPPETPPEQVQQQPPAFGSQFYTFDLAEDTDGSANRISLGTVSATDPDGGSVTYSIAGGNAAGRFEMDAASGELFYVGGGEDYETGSTRFELTVRASDGDQTTDTSVTVNVTDVAEAPAFAQAGYTFDLAEETDGSANRISLGTVSATDPDGGSVTYSIAGGNAAGLFEIDAASGELFYVGAGEDYDTGTTSFNLTVRASDGDQTTDTSVSVNVTDVDEPVEDNPPVTEPDQSTPQTVSEPAGEDFARNSSTSGRVAVGDTATGRIGSSGDRDWFAVELVAGRTYVIDLRGSPTGDGTLSDPYLRGIYDADGDRISNTTDDDGGQSYNSRVTLTATESGTHYIAAGAYSSRQGTYELEVTDTSPPETPPEQVQQQPPAFGSQFYTFDLAEDTEGSANRLSLGAVSATDADGGSVSYSIEGGNAAGLFEIDAASGELFYVGAGEDYDTGSTSFNLTVRASDGDETTDATVTVNVTDVAEAPAFGQAGYAFDLVEETDGSTDRISLGTVTATDPDGGSVTYSIEGGNAAGLFELDAASGELFYTGGGEDYETGSTSFELTVRASDGDQTTDTAVTVNVTDVDEPAEDNPPVVEPDQSTPQTVSEPAGEDFARNSSTSGRVAVGDTATGRIGSNGDRDWFAVELVAGRTYVIDLRGSPTGDGTLSDPYLGGVYDADGNRISNTTDDDGGQSYNSRVTFTATESGTHYIAAEAWSSGQGTYELEVTDTSPPETPPEQVQQQPPAFGSQFYAFDLAEDTDGSTDRISLGTVSATDPDGGSVTYSIEGGNAAGLFEIDAASGELFYTGGGEDYETGSTSFELTVRASDGDQTTDTAVTVNVTDVDGPVEDNPPVTEPDQSTPQTVSEPSGEDFARDSSTSGRVAVGDTATGRIGSNGDRDWFAVELVAGRTYVIDLRGSPTGDGTLSDPYLRGIYDADGNRISNTADDDGGQGYNSRVSFTATESGTHYIAAGAYSGQGTYELEVTDTSPPIEGQDPDSEDPTDSQEPDQSTPQTVSEPAGEDFSANTSTSGRVAVGSSAIGEIENAGDQDWFAVELEAGKTYQIDTSGVPTGGGTLPRGNLQGVYDADGNELHWVYDAVTIAGEDDQVFLTPYTNGTYYLAVGDPSGATGTYTVRVTETEDDFPATVDTTGTVEVGGTATGEIENEGDRDWFAVELVAGQPYTIDLRGSPTGDGTLSDPYLRGVYDSNGFYISYTADNDGGHDNNSQLVFTPTRSGTHYIAAGASSGSQGTYELEVTHTTIDDDFPATVDTTGTVEVGGSATGEVEYESDRDWFAVELEAGKTYQIDVATAISGGGSLSDGRLQGVYNADGNRLHGVYDAVTIGGIVGGQYPGEHWEDPQVFFTPYEDGTYYLAVGHRTAATGTYTVRVTEIEDDFPATVDTTGTVEVGGTATGEIQYETDRDWFAVELTAGETYKVELLGGRGKGGTLQDPYIRGIYDSDYRLISGTTDYASGPHSNSEVLFTPHEDGTYYIAAGNFMSGIRDEDVGTYTLQVSIDDFRDDTDTTGTVEVGGSVTGEIEAQGDEDWFAVTLEAGKTYQIDMEGSETDGGTLENPFLYTMRDADGNYLRLASGSQNVFTSDQDSGEGLNSRVTFTPDEDGTYYLVAASGGHILAADSHGRSLGTYTLSVDELVDVI